VPSSGRDRDALPERDAPDVRGGGRFARDLRGAARPMHSQPGMNTFGRQLRNFRTFQVLALAVSLSALGCATTTTTSTTWTANATPYPRPGRVESVQEIVQRTEGNPAAGALAGALIGGFLFGGHGGPGTLFGAGAGAAVGAAASSGASEERTYQVLVHFDDGEYGMFVFRGYPPFPPGAAVVLTPQGLYPAGHP
jgi:outer membrane lipoprotein SlyB